MTYECAFDFTICKPKTSKFIGKSGVLELITDRPITETQIDELKNDAAFKKNIAVHLNSTLKQKNIFMITVTSIKPIQNESNPT